MASALGPSPVLRSSPKLDGKSADSPARARIVAAAIEVFGQYGFTKTTIREIAAAAPVSKPLFYRHFRNKQDVFEAAVDHVFTDWREALIAQVRESEESAIGALRVLFVGALEYGRARPLLGRLLNRDSQLLLSTQSDVWDRACDALRQLTAEILRGGVAAGEVRTDVPIEVMADLMTEVTFAFANRQLLTSRTLEPDEAESISTVMLGGVMATEHRGR